LPFSAQQIVQGCLVELGARQQAREPADLGFLQHPDDLLFRKPSQLPQPV